MRTIIALIIIALMIVPAAQADQEPLEAWVLCQPDSYVNVRYRASKNAEVIGQAYMGDHIELTGKRVGKWYHCLFSSESGDGWIREDYLEFGKPEIFPDGETFKTSSNVRTRYSIDGKIRKRLKKGSTLLVFAKGPTWSVSTQGIIMTEFLEAPEDGEKLPDV